MPRRGRLLLLAALFPSLFPLLSFAQALHFPDNEELRHTRGYSDPQLSPDGKQALLRVTDATADGGKSHLWLIDIAANTSRQLTYTPESDKAGEAAGVWMPDGRSILFRAKRGEIPGLYRLPMDGGEAQQLELKTMPVVDRSRLPGALPPPAPVKEGTQAPAAAEAKPEPLPLPVESFAVAPDGKTIAIVAADPETPGEKKQAAAKADAVWVDHEAHGSRLYLLDVATNRLTPVPLSPDIREVAWAHDSNRLLAVAEAPNNAADLGPANTLWLVDSKDAVHPAKWGALPPTVEHPVWSEDDRSVAYLAQARADAPPGYRDLYLYDIPSAASRNLSDGFKGSVGFQAPVSLPDGRVAQDVGMGFGTTLALFAGGRPAPELLSFPTPVVGAFRTNAARSGWLFFGSGSTQKPTLYYTADLRQPARALPTPPFGADFGSVAPERITWQSDRHTVEGLLSLPPGASESHRVPLILLVHGGPLGAFQDEYRPFVPFLVGQGWAVFETNPRGSSNYGAAFAAANRNDLGGGDYRDIMAGVDAVLKTKPIDADRLGLYGYSYGGEMAGFVEGKTSRFKGIVSGAPVIDQYSEYGTESSSWYDRWYFGLPWEHSADAWRQSPLSGVAHARTPFLLLQGEGDTTDPPGQSEEMYRALRQRGVPVDLLTYPRDDHGPLAVSIEGHPSTEPWHGFDARARIVAFFQKAFAPGPSR